MTTVRIVLLPLALSVLLMAGARPVSAQSAVALPRLAVGVDASASPDGSGGWSSVGPRVTVGLNRQTAVEFALAPERGTAEFSDVDYLFVQVRRTLYGFRRGTVFGLLGVGFNRETYTGRYAGDWLQPGQELGRGFGQTIGLGTEIGVASHASIRLENQFLWGDQALWRTSAGLTVPLIGRYPASPASDSTASAGPLPGSPLAGLRDGQRIWVTSSDGVRVEGEIAARTRGGLVLHTAAGSRALTPSEIRRIEVPDSLANGSILGLVSGGGAGLVFGLFLGNAICEGDTDCAWLGGLIFGGIGAGAGTLVGATVDSFRDGPRPYYTAPAAGRLSAGTRLVPIISARRKGAAAIVTW